MSDTTVNPAIEALFSALGGGQARMQALAQTVLANGADRALNEDYEGAIRAFKRAISLDPSSENVSKVYDLLGSIYIQQDRTDDAVKAYKTLIRMVPTDDNAHAKLGNIYFDLKQYGDAEKEYKTAVSINPSNSTNRYSLGQVYLATGRYDEAENLFKQVIAMDPNEYGGYYALGQTYAEEGRSREAIDLFNRALSLKKDFYSAYVDLGSAYADIGDIDAAKKQLAVLKDSDSDLASLLSAYIDTVTKPKMLAAYSTNGFAAALGPGTVLSDLSSPLAGPGSAQAFTMTFVFDKDMDAESVQNPFNWLISKADGSSTGGAYNWGLATPATDVSLSPIPISVAYNRNAYSATVTFLISQNASANGTIDPSHIGFTFRGKDAYGNAMDPAADQYSGISKIV